MWYHGILRPAVILEIHGILQASRAHSGTPPRESHSSSPQAMKEGVGRNNGRSTPSAPTSSVSTPLLPLRDFALRRLSTPSLCASSSAGPGTLSPHRWRRGRPESLDCTCIGEEIPDLEPVLPSTNPLPHLRTQNLLLGPSSGGCFWKWAPASGHHQQLAVHCFSGQ